MASMVLPAAIVRPLIGAGGYLGALGKALAGNAIRDRRKLDRHAQRLSGRHDDVDRVLDLPHWTNRFCAGFRSGHFTTAVWFAYGFVTWFNGRLGRSKRRRLRRFAEPNPSRWTSTNWNHRARFVSVVVTKRPTCELDDEEDEEELKMKTRFLRKSDEKTTKTKQFETIEEEPTTLKISLDAKAPDPVEEEPEPLTPSMTRKHLRSVIPKPHFKMPKKAKPEPEPSEREVVISQLNEAAEAKSIVDYDLPRLEMLSTVIRFHLNGRNGKPFTKLKFSNKRASNLVTTSKWLRLKRGR